VIATTTISVPPVARGLVVATGLVWLVMELRQGAHSRPEAVRADRGSRPVIRVATVVGVLGAILALRAAPGAHIGAGAAAAWIGLVLLWCGIGLRFWSFQTLGRYFTFTVQTSPDQPVITAGPYGVIRHPSYAGILLAVVGLGLFLDNWLSLVVLVAAVTFGIVYRIRVEERALFADLGDVYSAYAAAHKRLVPYVW
jgi:protein-S-isoprenylcysteine O-methyltransferase Ste14